MMEVLDPEEARAIVDPALQLMMDAVHRYEGYVAQSRGDGIFALIGAPIARGGSSPTCTWSAPRWRGLPVMKPSITEGAASRAGSSSRSARRSVLRKSPRNSAWRPPREGASKTSLHRPQKSL